MSVEFTTKHGEKEIFTAYDLPFQLAMAKASLMRVQEMSRAMESEVRTLSDMVDTLKDAMAHTPPVYHKDIEIHKHAPCEATVMIEHGERQYVLLFNVREIERKPWYAGNEWFAHFTDALAWVMAKHVEVEVGL